LTDTVRRIKSGSEPRPNLRVFEREETGDEGVDIEIALNHIGEDSMKQPVPNEQFRSTASTAKIGRNDSFRELID
jgi:hypothetical protein